MIKKMICFTAIVALLGIGVSMSQEAPESQGAPEKKTPLGNRHNERGLACGVCHEGNDKPTTAAKPEACLTCHGSLSAVAERTKDYIANPHKNHITETNDITCTQCHQGTKDDTVLCLRCHTGMKFK